MKTSHHMQNSRSLDREVYIQYSRLYYPSGYSRGPSDPRAPLVRPLPWCARSPGAPLVRPLPALNQLSSSQTARFAHNYGARLF